MHRYKTVVTDYEGMQGHLDTHAAQGWQLFSVSPDTWRKSVTADLGMDTPPFAEIGSPGSPTPEYTASYYMLVFHQTDIMEETEAAFAVEEELPVGSRLRYDE